MSYTFFVSKPIPVTQNTALSATNILSTGVYDYILDIIQIIFSNVLTRICIKSSVVFILPTNSSTSL